MLVLYMDLIDKEPDKLLFADIYYNYRKQMLLAAQKILRSPEDAEDAVQDALFRIAQNISSLPAGDPQKLRAYVLTAARNAAVSLLRQQKHQDARVDLDSLNLSTGEDLFEQVAASQNYAQLLQAIHQLPQPYQEVLVLICVEEQTVGEAADALRRSKGTVRQQLRRGKAMLVALCRKEGMVLV